MTPRRSRVGLVLLLTVLSAPADAQPHGDGTTARVRLEAKEPGVLKQSLEVSGFDVLWADAAHTAIDVVVDAGEWRVLQGEGLRGRIVDRGRPLRNDRGGMNRVTSIAP